MFVLDSLNACIMQQGFVEECTLLFENNLLEISKLYCIQFLATCHTNVLHCLCIHNLCVIKRYMLLVLHQLKSNTET